MVISTLNSSVNSSHTSITRGRDNHSIQLENRMRGGLQNLQRGEAVLVIFPRESFSSRSSKASRDHGDIAIVKRGDNGELLRCSGYTNKKGQRWIPISQRMTQMASVYVFNNTFQAKAAEQKITTWNGKIHGCYKNIKECLDIRKFIPEEYHYQASAYMFDSVPEANIKAMGLTRVKKTGTIGDYLGHDTFADSSNNNVIHATHRFGQTNNGRTVSIPQGKTLYSLAEKHLGNGKLWPVLAAANNIAFSPDSCTCSGQKHTRNIPAGHPIHIPNINNRQNPLADNNILKLLSVVAKKDPVLALIALAKLIDSNNQFGKATSSSQFAGAKQADFTQGLILGLLIAQMSSNAQNLTQHSSLTNNNFSPVQTKMDKLLGKNTNVNYSPAKADKHSFLAKLLKDIPKSRHNIAHFAYDEASKAGIDPEAYCRQLKQESRFNTRARSPVGAEGVCQFMPATGRVYGLRNRADRQNPYKAIPASVRMMARLTRIYGDQTLATVAYNGGERAIEFVQRKTGNKSITGNDWLAFMQARRNRLGSANRSAWHVETLNYAKKIMQPTTLAA